LEGRTFCPDFKQEKKRVVPKEGGKGLHPQGEGALKTRFYKRKKKVIVLDFGGLGQKTSIENGHTWVFRDRSNHILAGRIGSKVVKMSMFSYLFSYNVQGPRNQGSHEPSQESAVMNWLG